MSIPAEVLAAAEWFVVPVIEGDSDSANEDTPPDVVGLGLSLADWTSPGWRPGSIVRNFSEMFPGYTPRPLTADRCARVILQALDDEIIEVDTVDEIEILLALAPCCGPTNWTRLLRFAEAWEASAPDEAFEVAA